MPRQYLVWIPRCPLPKQKTSSPWPGCYDVISGPAGDRDWNRLRSLFVPQARFTQTAKAPDGSVVINLLGVDDFVAMAGDVFKKEPF